VLSLLCIGLVVVVVVTTDEVSSLSRRLALCAALAPVAGGLGALLAAGIAMGRGEARALFALGAKPSRVMFGATFGGVIVAAMGPLAVASGFADLEPLFPRKAVPSVWIAEADGGLRDEAYGVRVFPGGGLEITPRLSRERPLVSPDQRTTAVAVCLALLAMAAPLFATRQGSRVGTGFVATIALLGMIVAFQLAAAGRASPWGTNAPPLLMLAYVGLSRYRAPPRA